MGCSVSVLNGPLAFVSEPECPVEAIKPDTDDSADGFWLQVNTKYSAIWPNITETKPPPPDTEEWDGVPDKLRLLER